MSTPTQSAIVWPDKFLPGTTDNFVSNEIIVKDITATQIWQQLDDVSKWQSYYKNCDQITEPKTGPRLQKGDVFQFSTFGLPVLTCLVEEAASPGPGHAGRLAWSTQLGGDTNEKIEVYHAWLVEDLEGNRVRVMTQESQIGKPAASLATAKPNRMLLGHQDWLDGFKPSRLARWLGQGGEGRGDWRDKFRKRIIPGRLPAEVKWMMSVALAPEKASC